MKKPPPSITVGNVRLECEGDEVRIVFVKTPELLTSVSARVLETWGLRQLRENALVRSDDPAKAANA